MDIGVEAGEDAGRDHEPAKDEELAHSIEEGEGQVVRSDDNQERRIEPEGVVEGRGSDDRKAERDDEGDLHGKGVHGVAFGEGGGAAHEAEQELGERKDEHAAEDQGEDGGAGREPGSEDGGGEPDESGDELAGESAEEGGADVALGVGDGHGLMIA